MTETPFFSWQENHTLYSDAFNDIYYSRSGGLEEKEYVFLRGNSLPERWENKARFTIFELGFGAGLNFFATYHLWKKKFHQNGQLHFISLEKYPLPAEVVLHCLSIYPEYSQYMDSFSTRYTNLLPGLNRVISEKGFILDLYIGEAKDFFPEFYGKVDAWFLDGFSPAKNPELWSDEVFQFIRNHSADEATASTYTVAGQVRRGLESAGFQTMKIKGFGFKKEMLVAHRVLPEIPDTYKESYYAPGLSFSQKGERVTIIGAGFAGTSLANAFAKRGMRVQLVEEKESPGSGASGNPLGSFSLLLSAEKNPVYDLIFHGFSYLSRNLKDFQGEGKLSSYKRAGSLYVIGSLQERERYKRGIQAYSLNKEMAEILDPETCLERFGFKPAIGVLFFPESGYCSPKEFCEANLSVLNPENFSACFNTRIDDFSFDGKTWKVYNNKSCVYESEILVFANSFYAQKIEGLFSFPVKKNRGQIFYLEPKDFLHLPEPVLHGEGYAISGQSLQVFGSTFNPKDEREEVDPEHNVLIYQKIRKTEPALPDIDMRDKKARVSFRAVVPDHLPIVGPIPDWEYYKKEYRVLRHGSARQPLNPAKYQKGLYVLTGLGSRGIVYSGILAELVAAYACGESFSPTSVIGSGFTSGTFFYPWIKEGNSTWSIKWNRINKIF